MGADYLFSYLPAVTITPQRLEKLKTMVPTLTWDDFDNPDALPPDDDLEDAREVVLDALDWLEGADSDRKVATFHHTGLPYPLWMTGGMSWGETPTDAMAQMVTLRNCNPVWEQIKAWALEDQKRHNAGASRLIDEALPHDPGQERTENSP